MDEEETEQDALRRIAGQCVALEAEIDRLRVELVDTRTKLAAVRSLVKDTDGDWLKPEDFGGLVGELLSALGD